MLTQYSATHPACKATLRRSLRHARRNLSPSQHAINSRLACQRLLSSCHFKRAQSIAAYIANDGELDPKPIIKAALQQGKRVYLPIVQDNFQLNFQPFAPGNRLRRNRYGIKEPYIRNRRRSDLRSMDLIILPLVGFDAERNRIGMGGGYYDRALCWSKKTSRSKPVLIALAHEIQRQPQLVTDEWDIKIDKIISEKTVY